MSDNHIHAILDDYLDEQLSAEHRADIDAHLVGCAECTAELETARKLRIVLSALPVSGPRPGFIESALQTAKSENRRISQQPAMRTWIPAAVAAGLAVMVVGGMLLQQPEAIDNGLGTNDYDTARVAASVTMTLEEAKTVNLVFESASPVDDVILTVDLPTGVELAAYPGRMQMRWATSLEAGKNRLPLELVALDGMGGEIIATMRSEDTQKVFRIDIEVVDG